MIDFSRSPVSTVGADPIHRRDLLRRGGAAAFGLGLARADLGSGRMSAGGAGRSVILLKMVGGASPWETFDPKPDAPSPLRGPFDSISTAVPGVWVSEYLPGIARRMGQLSIIRSVYHDGDPTHDAGLRLLETGRPEPGRPSLGTIAALELGSRGGMPPLVVLPGLVEPVEEAARDRRWSPPLDPALAPFVVGANAGSRRFDPDRLLDRVRRWGDRAASQGLTGADAWTGPARGSSWDWSATRPATQAAFGSTWFGRNCWLAGRLVEAGTRSVVVNMATSLYGQVNWDAHGRHPFRTWDDYRDHLLPALDQGFSGLVDFLRSRGLLESTLVIATGEMGRTPWINESGGRDHWPGVWSALVAGGGTSGGQVIGASDPDGRPRDRPVAVAELVATVGAALGLVPADPSAVAPVGELIG